MNYRTNISGTLILSLNHMFFVTSIRNPGVLLQDGAGSYSFANVSKPLLSKGFETNLKLVYRRDFKLFAGYTFTDAKAGYQTGNQTLPLLPRHKLNLALVYEREGFLKAGLEAYFTGR